MTGRVAETLQRRWLAFEINETYLQASKFRFEADSPLVVKPLSPEKSVKQRVIDQIQSMSPIYQLSDSSQDAIQLTLPFLEEELEIMEKNNLNLPMVINLNQKLLI